MPRPRKAGEPTLARNPRGPTLRNRSAHCILRIMTPKIRLIRPLAACLALAGCGSDSSTSGGPAETTPAVEATPSKIAYDFTSGSTLASRDGFYFADPRWEVAPIPGTSLRGLPFTYDGVAPGKYGMAEMRFGFSPTDEFWLSFRWHVPANYAHRHDTRLEIPSAETAGWALGDTVAGTDGLSKGTISELDSTGIFLRFAAKSIYNEVWVGKVTNLSRQKTATSRSRSQWPANNKLLALWCDDYSAAGQGPTVVFQTDLDWPSGEKRSILTVGHSIGGHRVTEAPVAAGVVLDTQDLGRFLDVVVHLKFSTDSLRKDGVIQSWTRRRGETAYTLRHDIHDADLAKPRGIADSLRFWRAGYLMGWSNSGFDQTTTFHISRLEFSTTPLPGL